MKKLLALLLVFAMSSAAVATLQISVGGVQDPVDSEIWLLPSETIWLDIWTDADMPMFDFGAWAIVVTTNTGTITGGVAVFQAADVVNSINGLTSANPGVIPPAGMEGIWGQTLNLSATVPIPSGTTLIDEILFHCVEEGDATIGLYAVVEDVPFGAPIDTVIIHQIPEPMTIALLGLGGLFLLRRRK